MRQSSGYTLTELVMTIAILAVIATIAVPAMTGSVMAARAATERAALMESLQAALNYSIANRAYVVFCASSDGEVCLGGSDWTPGWMAFVDDNHNRIRDIGESALRERHQLPSGIRLHTSIGRPQVVFQPFGGVNAGTNATLTLCDRRGPAKASTLVIANSGNIRADRASETQALACLASSAG